MPKYPNTIHAQLNIHDTHISFFQKYVPQKRYIYIYNIYILYIYINDEVRIIKLGFQGCHDCCLHNVDKLENYGT